MFLFRSARWISFVRIALGALRGRVGARHFLTFATRFLTFGTGLRIVSWHGSLFACWRCSLTVIFDNEDVTIRTRNLTSWRRRVQQECSRCELHGHELVRAGDESLIILIALSFPLADDTPNRPKLERHVFISRPSKGGRSTTTKPELLSLRLRHLLVRRGQLLAGLPSSSLVSPLKTIPGRAAQTAD